MRGFLFFNPCMQHELARAHRRADTEMRNAAVLNQVVDCTATFLRAIHELGDGIRPIEDVAGERPGLRAPAGCRVVGQMREAAAAVGGRGFRATLRVLSMRTTVPKNA